MARTGRTSAILISSWLLFSPPVWSDVQPRARIAILYRKHATYRKAAESLASSLNNKRFDCREIELPDGERKTERQRVRRELLDYKPTIIATAGTSATSFALASIPKVPVVFFMVPNAKDASFLAADREDAERIVGVTTDIAPEDQIEYIRKLLPDCKRIAVLFSDRTQKTVEALKSDAADRGMTIVAVKTDKLHFPQAMEDVQSARCDGILMIPDAKVYNSASVQRVLLWGIRERKAVLAFSEGIVRAGALAGLYSDSRQITQQAAELIETLIREAKLPSKRLQYARQFQAAINERTATMTELFVDERIAGINMVRFGGKP